MKFKLKNMEKKLTEEKVKHPNSEKISEKPFGDEEQLTDENKEKTKNADEIKPDTAEEELVVEDVISKLEAENKELKDKFLRKVAEFENYKRRIENDQLNFLKYANENLIKELLPILDDFERSLNFTGDESNPNNIIEGIKLIYDKFQKVLTYYGLREIESLNKPFDFHLHEALLQVPKDDVPPHTVVEEVEKGYMLKDKVIKHAKVIVSCDSNGEKSENESKLNNNTAYDKNNKKVTN
jgi:molecular chaperone GrpE